MRIGKRSRTARAEAQYTISMRFADDSVVEITVRGYKTAKQAVTALYKAAAPEYLKQIYDQLSEFADDSEADDE